MKNLVLKLSRSNLVRYLGLGYISAFLNVILNLLLIKLLDISSFGKVTLGKSMFQSFDFSHLGVRYGLDRYLPHCKELKESSEIFTIGFVFSTLFSLFFVLFWFFYDVSNVAFYSFFYISGVFYSIITIYRIYYRAEDDKTSFVSISFYATIIPLIFQIVGVYLFGLYGFITSHLVSYLFSYLICYFWYDVKIIKLTKESLNVLLKLLKSGYLVFISSIVSFLASTGDRFFIAKYWGLEFLGVFGVVMFFFSVFSLLSVNYTELIMNKIILKKSFKYVIKQTLFLVSFVFAFTVLAFFILPFFIDLFIPKYTNCINDIRLILIGVIPYSFLPILNSYLHAIDKREILLGVNVISTSIYFIILFFLLKGVRSLEFLIYLKIASFFLLMLLTLISSFICSKRVN